eukprot:COSAG05_NODE_2031_length_3669_cov_1.983193_5_plen_170_part_01
MYDGRIAMQKLREAAVGCPKHAALLERVVCDEMTYVRVFNPPSDDKSSTSADITVTSWERLFGRVQLTDACSAATEDGFVATPMADGRLRLEYSHGLMHDGNLNCSIASQHAIIYKNFYRDGSTAAQDAVLWASDQQEVSIDEVLLVTTLYARSRLHFTWKRAGDTIVLD